ncbi:GNAT family N-acetyltransferase [Salinisphaera hydrothermalis]|uniref:N-acetyltransferase GCN5 n=1 Tax=Salinisphaera hydrothermalis (strain C41B8) TaxID=1304275 RepID=A0A084IGL8_SALHC|nr:GNAT family N-acetyltransferase [Salinisphaera hydrothermalis]KEZ75852.1 N-acetyltransferase GCN5 [Salinisphaera hydrothermalis C41B8]
MGDNSGPPALFHRMAPTANLRIERLTPDADMVDTVADWTRAAWGHLNPEITRAAWRIETCDNAGPAGVPSTFVAWLDGRPVGTASLVAHDMKTRTDLTPWLASVYVEPTARGRGVASALVRRVENEARSAGLAHFYLYTPDQQRLYARLGWEPVEQAGYLGERVTIMKRQLDARSA